MNMEYRSKKLSEESCNHNWILGRIYFNKADKRILVKRKSEFSYTMNLGNKRTWIVNILIFFTVIVCSKLFK